jgi:hypothetical protein
LSTDGAQGAVFRAHAGAQQRLCGKVQRQQRALYSCIYSCFVISTRAKSVVFLHLFLFYDSYDSKKHGLLASTPFMIPMAAKGVVFLHRLLFYDSYDSKKRGLLASTFVL